MTYEEALASLIDDGIKLGAGDYIPMETLEMCREALEKQIPKKPIMLEQIYVCPTCGDSFNMNEYEMSCCWECGQKLDWNEVE